MTIWRVWQHNFRFLRHDSSSIIGVLGASLTGDKTNNDDATIIDGLVGKSTGNYCIYWYGIYSNTVANSKGVLWHLSIGQFRNITTMLKHGLQRKTELYNSKYICWCFLLQKWWSTRKNHGIEVSTNQWTCFPPCPSKRPKSAKSRSSGSDDTMSLSDGQITWTRGGTTSDWSLTIGGGLGIRD